ncbi:hypothetical protein HK102_000917, partial [Quaeritorhiza haematococci]
IDTYLRTQSNTFNQDQEVDRILNLHAQTKNPLELLELSTPKTFSGDIDLKKVKITYRKKSLLLHPDKCRHPRAQEAFEILKQAELWLMDDDQRAALVGMIREAREAVFRNRKISVRKKGSSEAGKEARESKEEGKDGKEVKEVKQDSDDPELVAKALENPDVMIAVRMEVRKTLRELESREEIKMKNEVERRAKKAQEVDAERKRKAAHEKAWEETRDERVGNWRKFMKDGVKKKKRKKDDDVWG